MSTQIKKDAAREAILAYILENGLQDIGLRRLAEVTGISDRMLIYYFGTKEALLTDVFANLADRVIAGMEAVIGDNKRSSQDLIDDLDNALAEPALKAVMMLLIEAIALALRGTPPYHATVMEVHNRLKVMVEDRLIDPSEVYRVITVVEGQNLWRLVEGC